MSEDPKDPEVNEEVNAAEDEEKAVEEKPEKPEKKPEKKKKEEKRVSSFYKIEEKGLTRLRPFCERCGPGYFMADHGNRYTCGHCAFSRYKQNQE